jgi:hypothetical protein
MSTLSTLALLLLGMALAGYSWWRLERPRPLGEVRLYPATLLLGVGLILTILALAHLLSLETGMSLRGRLTPY